MPGFDVLGKTVHCKVLKVDVNKSLLNSDDDYIQNDCPLATYSGYNDRLIACNGDCGSEFAFIIDHIIQHKVM